MKVLAVGGKAFFFKDQLKALGFRWFRDQKLWVLPEDQGEGITARLDMMTGVTWDVLNLPVEALFVSRSKPEAVPASVSSLERARRAMRPDAAPAPATNLAVASAPADEYEALQRQIAAVRGILDTMERDLAALKNR